MESYGDSLEITFDNSKTTTHTYISKFCLCKFWVISRFIEKKSLYCKNAWLHNLFSGLKASGCSTFLLSATSTWFMYLGTKSYSINGHSILKSKLIVLRVSLKDEKKVLTNECYTFLLGKKECADFKGLT